MKKSVDQGLFFLHANGGELSVLLASVHFLLDKLQSERQRVDSGPLYKAVSVQKAQAVWLV
jgi:hypothetical protein